MSTHKSSVANKHRHENLTTLKPALASIDTGRKYLGDPSKSKFYADILPDLETIKFNENDKRKWIIVASMDRLIEARRTAAADIPTTDAADLAQAAVGPALGQQVSGRDPAARTYRHRADELSRNQRGDDHAE